MLFPEAPPSCGKKMFEIIFAALYFYLKKKKKDVSDFKILFHTGNINIPVVRGVFSSRHV